MPLQLHRRLRVHLPVVLEEAAAEGGLVVGLPSRGLDGRLPMIRDSVSHRDSVTVNLLQPEATFKSEVLLVVNPLKIVANLPGPGT